ncbi:MAG TPA: hypothetical protein VEW25_13375 [Allosphingosinicella sp.]|nr:hypothetical protein [Allosphingosinicella sp.]
MLAEIVEAGEDLLGGALDGMEPVATTAQDDGREQSWTPLAVGRCRAIAKPRRPQKRIMIHFAAKAEACSRNKDLAGRRPLPPAGVRAQRTLEAGAMAHRTRLLAAGIAGIALVALAPHARDLWEQSGAGERQAQRQLFIDLKNREIQCLERLASGGFAKGADVQAEIARCRALAVDPATGEVVRDPG